MQDRQELVKLVARMWKAHYKQEALYMSLVGMEISRSLKSLCANGHMSTLVFRHELNQIYESFKCPFSDGDLWKIIRSEHCCNSESPCQTIIMARLFEGHNDLTVLYRNAIELLWDNDESLRMCADHLEKLSDLNQALHNEYDRIRYFQNHHIDYQSVA